MSTVEVKNIDGEVVGSIDLDDAVFGVPVKEHLLWEVVRAQRASWRAGSAKTKGRSDRRGGGKKPYRQKGTGRARQGSRRAPNHVGGGTVFGPKPRSYAMDTPKKVRRGALRSAVSLRNAEEKLIVLESFDLEEIKTQRVTEIIGGLLDVPKNSKKLRALIVDGTENENLARSARNLPLCKVLPPGGLNVYDILHHDTLILTKAAAKAVEERLRP